MNNHIDSEPDAVVDGEVVSAEGPKSDAVGAPALRIVQGVVESPVGPPLPEISVRPFDRHERGSYRKRQRLIHMLARLKRGMAETDHEKIDEGYTTIGDILEDRLDVVDGSITSLEYVDLLSEVEVNEVLTLIIGAATEDGESDGDADPTSSGNNSSGSPKVAKGKRRNGSWR